MDKKVARIVLRIEDMKGDPSPSAAPDACAGCGRPVWVNLDRDNPYNEFTEEYLCTWCALGGGHRPHRVLLDVGTGAGSTSGRAPDS